jgi:WD40 repeat protein
LAVIYFTDNAVGVYCTRTGQQIEKVMGIPRSCGSFSLSGNSRKLLFGNNNTLCLWNVSKGGLEISSNQWRNINCYALDARGRQMALGTYQGTIVVLTHISDQKVTEMELKRHKSCVMLIGWGSGEGQTALILSVSYDKVLLTSVLSLLPSGERGISYKEINLDTIPRGVGWHSGRVYLFEDEAIYWLEGNRLRGHADGRYAVSQMEASVVMIRYAGGVLEWFKK